MTYDWLLPSLVPPLVPWLAMLALLILKPNRCLRAWWIVVPLGLITVLAYLIRARAGSAWLFSEMMDTTGRLLLALAFSLAAVWLLAGHLSRRHRLVVVAGVFAIQSAFALLTFVTITNWGDDFFHLLILAGLLLVVLVQTTALGLAALLCRGRYGFWRLSVRLPACLIGLWLVVFGAVGLLTSLWGETVEWGSLLLSAACFAGICFLPVVPFLILAAANPLFRERLKELLSLSAKPKRESPVPDVPAEARAS